jgi:exosome complex component RRP45
LRLRYQSRPSEAELLLSRLLEKAIRRSNALDTESLCIVAGSRCFTLRADIHVLDLDGGLVDCCCVALLAALRHFRRPDVSVDGEDVRVWDLREREGVPLSILHHPYCVSFSFYGDPQREIVIADADLKEEQCRLGHMVVTANKFGELCQIAKHGGATVDALTLLNCARQATEQVKAIDKFVDDKLTEDGKSRNVGGLMAELRAENER